MDGIDAFVIEESRTYGCCCGGWFGTTKADTDTHPATKKRRNVVEKRIMMMMMMMIPTMRDRGLHYVADAFFVASDFIFSVNDTVCISR
jgi:hypothetical protein